jgi:hypothetical protein
MVALERFGATYGSGGIGRNIANPMVGAKEHFSTQLKVDKVTTMVEKALSYSPGFYFKKFPYYLDVFIVFFLASLFIFYQSPSCRPVWLQNRQGKSFTVAVKLVNTQMVVKLAHQTRAI